MTKRKVFIIKRGTWKDRARLAQERKEYNRKKRLRASTPTIADAIGPEMAKQLASLVVNQ